MKKLKKEYELIQLQKAKTLMFDRIKFMRNMMNNKRRSLKENLSQISLDAYDMQLFAFKLIIVRLIQDYREVFPKEKKIKLSIDNQTVEVKPTKHDLKKLNETTVFEIEDSKTSESIKEGDFIELETESLRIKGTVLKKDGNVFTARNEI